jgi:hypothetical protein
MIVLPLKIESTLNKREHWGARRKRAKQHRDSAYWGLAASKVRLPDLPQVIRLTRIAPRELDTDNLAGGFKSIRDGIADWLLIDDKDKRVEWRYAQEVGKPKEYACRIELIAKETT